MATSPLIVKVTFPRRDFTSITQLGLKAHGLAVLHQAKLEARLPAGTIAGLAEDLGSLDVAVPGAVSARVSAKNATEEQNAVLARAKARIQAFRTAVRHTPAPIEVQRAYGVGSRITTPSVTGVTAAISQILARVAERPEEAASLGILQSDVDALTALRDEVAQANTTQEKKRASAPMDTKERNRIGNRIVNAVKRIKGAAAIAFADSPVERALFEELRLGPPRASGKAKVVAPEKPSAPANPSPIA